MIWLAIAMVFVAVAVALPRVIERWRDLLDRHGQTLGAALRSVVSVPVAQERRAARCVLASCGPEVDVSLELREGPKGHGSFVGTGRMQVDVLGLEVPLRLRPRARVDAAGLKKALGEVGDPAFDAAWVVEADAALAKGALGPELRARLTTLVATLPGLSAIELGPRGLSIEWDALTIGHDSFRGPRGDEVRWTMGVDPKATMAQIEEDIVGLRAALLAHAEAPTASTGGLFRDVRVAVDPAPEAETVESTASTPRGARSRTSP